MSSAVQLLLCCLVCICAVVCLCRSVGCDDFPQVQLVSTCGDPARPESMGCVILCHRVNGLSFLALTASTGSWCCRYWHGQRGLSLSQVDCSLDY